MMIFIMGKERCLSFAINGNHRCLLLIIICNQHGELFLRKSGIIKPLILAEVARNRGSIMISLYRIPATALSVSGSMGIISAEFSAPRDNRSQK